MRIRVRAPAGAVTITLPDDATVGDLLAQITEKTSIAQFDIKLGYPPKPLLLEQSDLPLSKLETKLDGEQLTISQKDDVPAGASAGNATSQKSSDLPASAPKSGQPRGDEAGRSKASGPVSLQRKEMAGEVPEIPFPERGSTVGKSLPISGVIESR